MKKTVTVQTALVLVKISSAAVFAGPQGKPQPTAVAVNVDFLSANSAGTTSTILGAPLRNGQNGVSALIKDGELVAQTGTQQLTFTWEGGGQSSFSAVSISTQQAGTVYPLDKMSPTETHCVQMAYTWKPTTKSENRLVFQRWWESGSPNTSFARVTCTAGGAAACSGWESEPLGCPGGPDNIGALYDTTNTRQAVRLDYYAMPHRLLVTKVQ